MRVATVDGLVTLFYDGSKQLFSEELYEEWWEECSDHGYNEEGWEEWDLSDECKQYLRERQSWQQVIVVEGVTEIPERSFQKCFNIQKVIFANTVVRINPLAFADCSSLSSIKLSINIEVIESGAFIDCNISRVFLPPRCREIGNAAFRMNNNLTIFNVPQDTEIDLHVISETKLIEESHFQIDERYNYDSFPGQTEEVVAWIKNMNSDNKYSLHRACSSYKPLKEVINAIVEKKGIGSFHNKNSIGITPSQYLMENPFADVTEKDIIRDYIMKMMGEYE
ncbi:hypothetical protein CTEN210_02869 [Chaetoceros tenuissimus]|uniref:Leucine-rich repeat domain-containing protein n=1 Tax=Chaetoceros tenuissimus TaxID=426638 RepID=A0AAD3CKL8_9STRA|nr:hypothetical protein CTEN210_02869 [Chaetoceros tenuissimus]